MGTFDGGKNRELSAEMVDAIIAVASKHRPIPLDWDQFFEILKDPAFEGSDVSIGDIRTKARALGIPVEKILSDSEKKVDSESPEFKRLKPKTKIVGGIVWGIVGLIVVAWAVLPFLPSTSEATSGSSASSGSPRVSGGACQASAQAQLESCLDQRPESAWNDCRVAYLSARSRC